MKTRFSKYVATSFLAALTLTAGVALAAPSNITGAKILSLRADPFNGQGIINIDLNDPSRPACATYNSGKSFTINFSSDAGRETYRLAMAAFLAGRTVDITGTGACTQQSNKEAIDVLTVN
ncbi:MAG TPA: hypothetical protein VJN18_06755 [Polyangiaceae bacterium]|nr:hypothetical protein [Polyangiaceae bacterium]